VILSQASWSSGDQGKNDYYCSYCLGEPGFHLSSTDSNGDQFIGVVDG
jgi:hypothetical protein